MAVKFRHKETGLFWCRAKGRSPSRNEYYEGTYIQSDTCLKLITKSNN